MGEVYEAEDLELGERIALKTLRLGDEEATRAVERFRRETLIARRVTHPNVCRIFDVFRHEEDGTKGTVLLLSMELLEGATLAEKLRGARLSTAETLPILRQIAAALDAAHEAGIVHRDLKPENVMLVPSEKGARAVVMDFGIAHSSVAVREALTGTGEVLGTLAYMAPEQVEGKTVSPATDVYALGVVLYEMLTGRPPFAGESPLATAVMRLKQSPPSPRSFVPDLDERWERAVLRCLALEPENRFESAAALVDYVQATKDHTGDEPARTPRVLAVAFAGVLLLGAGMLLFRRSADPAGDAIPASIETRRAVAVVGFKNLTGDPQSAWLSTALSEMLTTELAASERLRVVPGEMVARVKSDLALPESDSFASDTLERIRLSANADLVVVGAYTALGEPGKRQIRLDLKLQDTARGETAGSFHETGTEAELFALVSGVGASLRERLALGERSETEARAVRASLPATPESTRAYSEGLASLRVYDYLGARKRLEQAVALDPDYPLAHAALADAWYQLSYERNAVEAARRAFELSKDLTREERLFIEARYREVNLEREKAIEIYETLWGFFPDNIDYGLHLASLQFDVFDQRSSSTPTLAALKRIPGSENDPRVDLAEVELAWSDHDPNDAEIADLLAIARRAAEKAKAQGARGVEARARLEEAYYLDLPQALAAYEKARLIYEEAGDGVGVVRALRAAAERLNGDKQFDRARGMLEQALETARAIGAEPAAAEVLIGLASVHVAEGDFDRALAYQEEALRSFRDLDSTSWIARANFERAHILRTRGRTAEALGLFQESLETCRIMSQGPCIFEALNGKGVVLMDQGDLSQAEALFEEAIAHTTRIGYERAVSDARVSLAFVLVEAGRATEAETALRRHLDAGPDVYAELTLARALLAQSKTAEARDVSARVMQQLVETNYDSVYYYERSLRARITAALIDQDLELLDRTLGEARRLGLLNIELEARLARAEIEKDSRALEAVERDARASGYRLVARKAAEARRRE